MPIESDGFKGISLKASLVNDVENFIKNSNYKSVAEFASEAVRLRLQQLQNGKSCEKLADVEV